MDKFYKKYAPDPLKERKDYEFLCGEWDFCFADENPDAPTFDKMITVPYSYESKASGIGDATPHTCVWYSRKFSVKKHSGAILLHFEGVDYHSFVYINKTLVNEHIGGFTKFCIDITSYVKEGENEIEVKVFDSLDKSQLRGKQRAKNESYECWYVQTTGIWKPVWIEYVGSVYVKDIEFKSDMTGNVTAKIQLSDKQRLSLEVTCPDGISQCMGSATPSGEHIIDFKVVNMRLWNSESPDLYTVNITVHGETPDKVSSYFGISDVSVREDGMYINGKKEYQQMVLDQGYWADTMLSAPDDEALEKDIDLIKAMGFNGIRVHQKVENDVFYYLCDKKGIYVWGEIPSAYEFTTKMQSEFMRDAKAIFEQLKKHVSIVCWLLFNETWGISDIRANIAQQEFVGSVEQVFRGADNRPVITNDGWYHLNSDVLSLHEYEQSPEVFEKEYKDKDYVVTDKVINTNKFGTAFANGYAYRGQPVFISEYGGIAIDDKRGWGYGECACDVAEYKRRLNSLVDIVMSIPYVSGACYTQFTDVQQETNGLLYADRTPKIPLSEIKDIFSKGK